MLLPLTIAAVCAAAIPAVLTVLNLQEFHPPPPVSTEDRLADVAVCIPARNEEAGIAACVASVLASSGVSLDVIVMNDASTDHTASIVADMAATDSRVRLLHAPPLPAGWNGKQHACWCAAQATGAPLLCFLDADVRLEPAAAQRMAALLMRESTAAAAHRRRISRRIGLVSGFPHEETATALEVLLLPLIHFVLLGFLPLALLRRTTLPGFAAGCGQFLLVRRDAYFECGGHAAIRTTLHDGLMLPRLLRRHGYATRLADLTELARCRMYHSAATTWNGLAKNATEGMASTGAIVPFTLLLGMGQVLPVLLLVYAALRAPDVLPWAWAAVVLSYLPRLLELKRFRQRASSAVFHPLGVAVLLVLQWYAFMRKLVGRPAQWKHRKYAAN